MCNEREDGVWFIHASPKSSGICGIGTNDDRIITTCSDGWTSATVSNVHTKDEHADCGVGANRKFDVSLVEDIDRVFGEKWSMPEYLPFRECIRMAIQDGIHTGMANATRKYEKMLDEKEKKVQYWKNAFTTLLTKCKDGVQAYDQLVGVLGFISKVIHHSEAKD